MAFTHRAETRLEHFSWAKEELKLLGDETEVMN
jgi:hypothetical protein